MNKYWFILFGCFAALAAVLYFTTSEKPRFDAMVVCFNGKIDQASSCSSIMKKGAESPMSGDMTCGNSTGKSGRIRWDLKGSVLGADIYEFTRQFPADDPAARVVAKKIRFRGERIVIFEDANQTVVIDPLPEKK